MDLTMASLADLGLFLSAWPAECPEEAGHRKVKHRKAKHRNALPQLPSSLCTPLPFVRLEKNFSGKAGQNLVAGGQGGLSPVGPSSDSGACLGA